MLDIIWVGMIGLGIIWGAIQGKMPQVTQGILDGSKDTASLIISMAGMVVFWSGIMEVADQSGLLKKLSKLIQPFLSYLFPEIPKEHLARRMMSANIIANIFGLGWAATPTGLQAMKELKELNSKKDVASRAMCAFLVLNISSLQLIPVNIIAYRNQYHSINPAKIVGPGIIATTVSTLSGIIFIRLMMRRKE